MKIRQLSANNQTKKNLHTRIKIGKKKKKNYHKHLAYYQKLGIKSDKCIIYHQKFSQIIHRKTDITSSILPHKPVKFTYITQFRIANYRLTKFRQFQERNQTNFIQIHTIRLQKRNDFSRQLTFKLQTSTLTILLPDYIEGELPQRHHCLLEPNLLLLFASWRGR